MSTPRVMVGVSGGVDSSVAAWRLVQQGEAVAGLFMQNWADDGSGECRADKPQSGCDRTAWRCRKGSAGTRTAA